MELLLKSGASALLCDARGRSPLHAASQAGARQAVAALLRLLPPPRRDQLLLLPDLSGATAADLVRCFCCLLFCCCLFLLSCSLQAAEGSAAYSLIRPASEAAARAARVCGWLKSIGVCACCSCCCLRAFSDLRRWTSGITRRLCGKSLIWRRWRW